MIAHGIWDVSAFLSGSNGAAWAGLASLFVLLPIGLVVGIVAMVSIWRTDRHTVVTPSGITGDSSQSARRATDQ
jgi:uncharacterized protein